MSSKRPIRLGTDRDPWDKQDGESPRMYARFRTYLELDRTRTLTQAAEILHSLGDKVAYRTLRQYSYENRWAERAGAFDIQQDRLEAQRLIKLRREATARHRKVAGGLFAKAIAALQNFQPADLSPADVSRFVKLAVDIERASLGEPERTVAVTGPAGGPVAVEDFTGLTSQERQARLAEIQGEIARRLADHDDDE